MPASDLALILRGRRRLGRTSAAAPAANAPTTINGRRKRRERTIDATPHTASPANAARDPLAMRAANTSGRAPHAVSRWDRLKDTRSGRAKRRRQEHAQTEVVRVIGQPDRPAESVLARSGERERGTDGCTADEKCCEVVPVAGRPERTTTRAGHTTATEAAKRRGDGAPVEGSATRGPESATDDEECCDGEEPAMWATEEVPNANSVVAMTSRRTESQQRGRRRTA